MISHLILGVALLSTDLTSWTVISEGGHVALCTYTATERPPSSQAWNIQSVLGPTQLFSGSGSESPGEHLFRVFSVPGPRITMDLARIGQHSILASDYHGGALRGIIIGYFDQQILPVSGPCPRPFKRERLQAIRLGSGQPSPRGLKEKQLVWDVYSPRLVNHRGQPWLLASGYIMGAVDSFCWVTDLRAWNSGVATAVYIGDGEDPEVAIMPSGEVVVALKAPKSGRLVSTPSGGSVFEANRFREIRFLSSENMTSWESSIEAPEGIKWVDFDIAMIDEALWVGGTVRNTGDTFAVTVLQFDPLHGWIEHLFEPLDISEKDARTVALVPVEGAPALLARPEGRLAVFSTTSAAQERER